MITPLRPPLGRGLLLRPPLGLIDEARDHLAVDVSVRALGVEQDGRHADVPGANDVYNVVVTNEDDLAAGRLHLVEVKDTTIMQPVRAIWRGARPSIKAAARLLDAVLAARSPALFG